MPANKTQLGPGTLVLGDVGSPIDISCQVINAMIEWEKDKDDDVVVLCGDTVAGSTMYTASITGELFQDVDDPAGILATSWAQKGQETPFTFVPNTEAGTSAEGVLVLDPISFGGDEAKANMTSDFTWSIVGEPTLTIGAGGAHAGSVVVIEVGEVVAGRVTATVEVVGGERLASTIAAASNELLAMASTNRAVASAILAAAHPPILTGALAGSLIADADDEGATVSSSLIYAPVQERRHGFLAAALAASHDTTVALHLAHINGALATVKGT